MEATASPRPPLSHWLNLTNGLALASLYPGAGLVRIQSTACEQKRWVSIVEDLGYELPLRLALGHRCVVHDVSERHRVTRALWQGVPWIRYALTRAWLGVEVPVIVRGGHNATGYFRAVYDENERAIRKAPVVAYAARHLATDAVRLESGGLERPPLSCRGPAPNCARSTSTPSAPAGAPETTGARDG